MRPATYVALVREMLAWFGAGLTRTHRTSARFGRRLPLSGAGSADALDGARARYRSSATADAQCFVLGDMIDWDQSKRAHPAYSFAVAHLLLTGLMEEEMIDKDRIVGSAKVVGGKVKEAIGKAVGDAKLEAKGKADKIEGKVQNAVGDLKDTLKGK